MVSWLSLLCWAYFCCCHLGLLPHVVGSYSFIVVSVNGSLSWLRELVRWCGRQLQLYSCKQNSDHVLYFVLTRTFTCPISSIYIFFFYNFQLMDMPNFSRASPHVYTIYYLSIISSECLTCRRMLMKLFLPISYRAHGVSTYISHNAVLLNATSKPAPPPPFSTT